MTSERLTEPIEQWLDDLARDLAGPLGTDARVERIRSALPAAFREYREWGYAAGQAAERERIAPLVEAARAVVTEWQHPDGSEYRTMKGLIADLAAALEAHDDQ